jgi:pilus assembly protein Flp/PilA
VDEAFFAEDRENRAMARRGTGRDGIHGVRGPTEPATGGNPAGRRMGARPTAARRGRATTQHRPGRRDKEDTMRELWNNFIKDESGQGLVEYVLIIALIAVGLILVMVFFRNAIGNIFINIAQTLDDAPGNAMDPN